jgi:hypothetical protein
MSATRTSTDLNKDGPIPERFLWRQPDRPVRWPGEFEAERFVYNNTRVPWLIHQERERERRRRHYEAAVKTSAETE